MPATGNRQRTYGGNTIVRRVGIALGLSLLLLCAAGASAQDRTGRDSREDSRATHVSWESASAAGNDLPGIPDDFKPWWEREPVGAMSGAASGNTKPLPVEPQGLMLAAMTHSAQVRILRDSVFVKQSAIVEADGKFDVRAFAESKYVSTDDPVGSTLITGGPARWIDSNIVGSAGFRRTLESGGNVEISQQLGYEDSNSLYFIPPHQGTTRMALSLTQPLLNGAGKAYNTSVVLLADINSNIAKDQLSRDMQSLLLDLHKAYWDLYLQRIAVLQRQRLLEAGLSIRDELEARRNVDVLRGQIARARSAVANRRADLIRRQASARNAESRIRAMVNDPGLGTSDSVELVPNEHPGRLKMATDLQGSLVVALKNRPEIQLCMKEVRAAGIKADVATNELLPTLNAVLSTYVSGLRGYGDVSAAYTDQFSAGTPSFTAGLQFEMPLGNRVANARLNERRLEYRQATAQLEATTANVRSEVEIAVREVETTYLEMVSKYHACVADKEDVSYQMARWKALPYEQASAGFALDELLYSQDRLAQAELDLVSAEVNYNLSVIGMTRATGALVDAARLEAVLKCASSNASAPVTEPIARGDRPTPSQSTPASAMAATPAPNPPAPPSSIMMLQQPSNSPAQPNPGLPQLASIPFPATISGTYRTPTPDATFNTFGTPPSRTPDATQLPVDPNVPMDRLR